MGLNRHNNGKCKVLRIDREMRRRIHHLAIQFGLELPKVPNCADCKDPQVIVHKRLLKFLNFLNNFGGDQASPNTPVSRREEAEYLTCLQQMEAEGIAVVIPERWLEKTRSLDIFIAGRPATVIFDLPGGSAAFAIWVRLVARRRVTILDCAMTTAWDDQIVLEGFFDERTSHCWLGRRDYPRSQVLNPRIMNSLKFHGYDDMVEGVILFTGLKPMPVEFYHGMAVPFTLIFLDQNENEIRQEADLFVDRTWRREQKVARQISSLYERAEGSATSDPGLSQNINRGRVPAPVPSSCSPHKRAERDESDAASEASLYLRNALIQLAKDGGGK